MRRHTRAFCTCFNMNTTPTTQNVKLKPAQRDFNSDCTVEMEATMLHA